MTGWLTDKRFLVGVAVGFFVVPYASKFVREQVTKIKGAAAAA